MTIFALLLLAASSATAHETYPVRPVQVTLRVERDRIVADLKADSIIWIEEVTGLHPMPARDWPAETLARVESYVNSHFQLAAGSVPARGALVEARYRQFPWQVNEEGTFFLRLVYPAASAGSTLSGAARFYEEYRKELESELAGQPPPFSEGYRTFVKIPGRRRASFTLTPEAPSFSAPVEDARRTSLAMALEGFVRGAEAALGAAAGFPAIVAIALCLGGSVPSRAAIAALLASAAAGFAAGGLIGGPSWTFWAATLGASLAAGRRRLALPMGAAASACVALGWCGAAKPALPHSALALPSALAGALAAGATLLFAAWFCAREEYRRLATVSESRVDLLFARRARLMATALAMIGAYGLWQSLRR